MIFEILRYDPRFNILDLRESSVRSGSAHFYLILFRMGGGVCGKSTSFLQIINYISFQFVP